MTLSFVCSFRKSVRSPSCRLERGERALLDDIRKISSLKRTSGIGRNSFHGVAVESQVYASRSTKRQQTWLARALYPSPDAACGGGEASPLARARSAIERTLVWAGR